MVAIFAAFRSNIWIPVGVEFRYGDIGLLNMNMNASKLLQLLISLQSKAEESYP